VLEVGAGSGYAAALLATMARRVVAIERHADLARAATARLAALGIANVRIIAGDGTLGCAAEAPFDAILASATGSHIPPAWIDQLRPGGRLVMPLGDPTGAQTLVRAIKGTDGQMTCERLGGVRFVPLIGAEGFAAD
jgi:protein-L-isoaspartate(D-aspartate) O-methyltransferase